jgi:isocitrate dehydrogenase (NAD+)
VTARRVVLLPGDGIGPEVTACAVRVVEAAGVAVEWDVHEVGAAAFEREGAALPTSVVDAVREAGIALKGPVSTPTSGRFRSVNLSLRQELDLFVQIRRCRSFRDDIDVLVARETTEDVYAGLEFPAGDDRTARVVEAAGATPGSAVTVKAVSEAAVRRATRAVVGYVTAAGRRRMTVVHKATAMPATDGLFLRAARDEAAAAGAIEVDDMLVDLAAAELVRHASRFDVIFTGNLYGDILADLLGAVVGSIGLVPGANLGDEVAVFEPAHGSAPRHAGHDRANPTAAILSAALLVRHLGHHDAADRIEGAVARVLREGRQVTYDVVAAGVAPVGTSAMADAVVAALDDPAAG